MRILALDTATDCCSIAIIDEDTLLAEINLISGETHSKHLMGMIKHLLHLSGCLLSDIDGFAVTRGPGSFTGLRIGISATKGLAMAAGKSMVGVSVLDALAFQLPFSSSLICPILDARKGEVYFALYRSCRGGLQKETEEQVLTPQQALSRIKEPCIFFGQGAKTYQKVIKEEKGDFAYFPSPSQNILRASTVAFIGMDRFKKKMTDDISDFIPHYIRKSDAELADKKKIKNQKIIYVDNS
ncbi:MAG: tRNA (adenosine(37)-N6)-threonylcarbamoyltransferase complex dimerization subunit type 1 TsaB [Desulfobacterales bacterium]